MVKLCTTVLSLHCSPRMELPCGITVLILHWLGTLLAHMFSSIVVFVFFQQSEVLFFLWTYTQWTICYWPIQSLPWSGLLYGGGFPHMPYYLNTVNWGGRILLTGTSWTHADSFLMATATCKYCHGILGGLIIQWNIWRFSGLSNNWMQQLCVFKRLIYPQSYTLFFLSVV